MANNGMSSAAAAEQQAAQNSAEQTASWLNNHGIGNYNQTPAAGSTNTNVVTPGINSGAWDSYSNRYQNTSDYVNANLPPVNATTGNDYLSMGSSNSTAANSAGSSGLPAGWGTMSEAERRNTGGGGTTYYNPASNGGGTSGLTDANKVAPEYTPLPIDRAATKVKSDMNKGTPVTEGSDDVYGPGIKYYSDYLRLTGQSGGSSKPKLTPGQAYNINTKLNIQTTDPAVLQAQREALSAELAAQGDPAAIDRVNYYDKQPLVDYMTGEIDAARQQYNNQINNAMDTQARDLNRALADAQGQFQTQQNQVDAAEMQALDNAALYAEARGDKGGIGQAQYNSIQNNAARNKLAVSQAQTKLATDTARQISDLRAQGEFERADKMLQLTQQYLSELRQIEQYAANYNLNVDQINTAISEWEYEYNQAAKQFAVNTELSLAELTGAFSNGMSTYKARQATQAATAELALSLIQAGVKPTQLSPTQLGALADYYGMSQTAINALYKQTN